MLTRVGAIVVGFVVAGAAAGALWEQLWTPPMGLAYEDQWFLEPAGPDLSFEGIALFVLIAFALGLVLAVVSGLWGGHELVTVAAVVVASVLAGAAMYAVGNALGPADPQLLAAGSPDFTPLPSDLGLTAPDRGRTQWHSTAFVALPAGAMTGLVGMYLFGSRGFVRRPRG
ncbi:hypothetical protein [Nocardioides zhouii]|uniref:DUF2567 domain-containing protein n=1 Tax=Nocardioides zhouii TaxID=1168729 RepID=A0A4Q2SIU6_9ACTN|nr:hypothetical protein [Nocardioides zhouii]RYC05466.1 hypothetical protein EUA94_18695 [Nocardioides zhouii]